MEEQGGEDDEQVIEVAKKTCRKPVKSPEIITDEMDDNTGSKKNDDAGGKKKRIEWSAADRTQAALDVEWSFQNCGDPCLVEDKDFQYGPLYWGFYSTLLTKPGPITKEQLPDCDLNLLDKDGHTKYILVDVYDTPCCHCTTAKQPKPCIFASLKPNPLAVTIEEEEKNSAACAYCKHIKRRCNKHSHSWLWQIIANPFHDPSTMAKGGSANTKAKVEKAKVETKAKVEPKGKVEPKAKVEPKVALAVKSHLHHAPMVQEVTMGKFYYKFPTTLMVKMLGTLQSWIMSLEGTCEDLAKKVVDMEGLLCRVINSSVDKMKLDIQWLEQDQKTTKAYVKQKTCMVMEALCGLGNAVHQTLENIMEVLDDVPEELCDALQNLAECPDGGDVDSALQGIRRMQSWWADLANLVEGLLPKCKQVEVVPQASTPPPQDLITIPAEVAPQSETAASVALSLPLANVIPQSPVSANDVDIEMADGEHGVVERPASVEEDNEEVEGSSGTVDELPTSINDNSAIPEDSAATPPEETLNAKQKLDKDANEPLVKKKKKRVAAPKEKGVAHHKVRGKVADANPTVAEDVEAEGEQAEA